jgi:hypothetical protein
MWVVLFNVCFLQFTKIFHNRENAVEHLTNTLCWFLFQKRGNMPVELTDEQKTIKKNIYDELSNDENDESDIFNDLFLQQRKCMDYRLLEMDCQDDDGEFGYVLK